MTKNGADRYWSSPAEAGLAKVAPASDLAAWHESDTDESVRRRSFLKAVGFGVSGLAMAGCERQPEIKAIPLLDQPAGFTPGRSMFYATTCGGCTAACGMLAKCLDGRPIKLEGLPGHPTSDGGLCAVGQASLLGLYDKLRFQTPLHEGKQATWPEVDGLAIAKLKAIGESEKTVCLLTGTINSPTLQDRVDQFLSSFTNARQVTTDALSSSAIADAHQQTHGVRAIPQFHFDKAEVIVSFAADFLGTWISPIQFTVQRTAGRQLDVVPPIMAYHAQFESCMSLTGSNADYRMALAPSDYGLALTHLAAKVAELTGSELEVGTLDPSPIPQPIIDDLANRLAHSKGKSLVVSGEQDLSVQLLCNFINHALGNYGTTLNIAQPSNVRHGNDAELQTLVDDMKQGKVGALLIHATNPVLELPAGLGFTEAMSQVEFIVQFATRADETTEHANVVCPTAHFLECWNDYEVRPGLNSIGQPLIQPLFDTRTLLETLAAWSGQEAKARDLIEQRWESKVFPQAGQQGSFRKFFHQAIHDGWVDVGSTSDSAKPFVADSVKPIAKVNAGDGFALVAYAKVGLLDGKHAYNPWLQELPDPVSKVTWDNYACLSVAAAGQLGVQEGDLVRLDFGGQSNEPSVELPAIELPVFIQPGMHDRVVAVALGYGGVATERFAGIGPRWIEARPTVGEDGRVGKNIAPLLSLTEGQLRNWRSGVTVAPIGKRRPLACTQKYNKITVPEDLAPPGSLRRPILQETSFASFSADPHSGKLPIHASGGGEIYPADHPKEGHHWGMAIDLTKCTGCSACVIACQAENNVPVVGRDEVRRSREMHWMRIDRYYSGEGDDVDVAHQPMLCQHCDNAPCENVCPVLATVHSDEGLNTQVYNRCVGTRYCANNCPYKVRRFNWFKYQHPDELQNMVLNPEVTVRSRGVMEKCSFCVQRLQNAKLEAKRRGVAVSDESVQTACQQSCPAGAIVFGDANNPSSRLSKMLDENPRAFRVLEEVGVKPSIHYLTLVRNGVDEHDQGDEQHG